MTALVTPQEYKKLSPRQQGYITYMQAEMPGSRVPKECPYTHEDGWKRTDWLQGQFAGVLEAQDEDS